MPTLTAPDSTQKLYALCETANKYQTKNCKICFPHPCLHFEQSKVEEIFNFLREENVLTEINFNQEINLVGIGQLRLLTWLAIALPPSFIYILINFEDDQLNNIDFKKKEIVFGRELSLEQISERLEEEHGILRNYLRRLWQTKKPITKLPSSSSLESESVTKQTFLPRYKQIATPRNVTQQFVQICYEALLKTEKCGSCQHIRTSCLHFHPDKTRAISEFLTNQDLLERINFNYVLPWRWEETGHIRLITWLAAAFPYGLTQALRRMSPHQFNQIDFKVQETVQAKMVNLKTYLVAFEKEYQTFSCYLERLCQACTNMLNPFFKDISLLLSAIEFANSGSTDCLSLLLTYKKIEAKDLQQVASNGITLLETTYAHEEYPRSLYMILMHFSPESLNITDGFEKRFNAFPVSAAIVEFFIAFAQAKGKYKTWHNGELQNQLEMRELIQKLFHQAAKVQILSFYRIRQYVMPFDPHFLVGKFLFEIGHVEEGYRAMTAVHQNSVDYADAQECLVYCARSYAFKKPSVAAATQRAPQSDNLAFEESIQSVIAAIEGASISRPKLRR